MHPTLGNQTVSGTLAEFNEACTDADFVSLDGAERLTNKTMGATTFDGLLSASAGLAVAGGNFTSRGISDKATTTALDIDSAGRVGIGAVAASNAKLNTAWTASGASNEFGTYSALAVNDATASNKYANYGVCIPAADKPSGVICGAMGFNNIGNYNVNNPIGVIGGFIATASFGAGKTIGNAVGFQTSFSNAGSGTITTVAGFVAQNHSIGTYAYGYYSAMASGTNRFGYYSAGTAYNYFAGQIGALGSYSATTAASSNMYIAADGAITRATSSARYKTSVENLDHALADSVVLGSRPVWYRSTCECDNPEWSWYGLIAEELAAIDPRLVHWGRPQKEITVPGVDGEPDTLSYAEDTDAPLRPEGVMYDRITVMLIDVVQRQQQTIAALEARVAALEAA